MKRIVIVILTIVLTGVLAGLAAAGICFLLEIEAYLTFIGPAIVIGGIVGTSIGHEIADKIA